MPLTDKGREYIQRAWFQHIMDEIDGLLLSVYNEDERVKWWSKQRPGGSMIRKFINGEIDEVHRLARKEVARVSSNNRTK